MEATITITAFSTDTSAPDEKPTWGRIATPNTITPSWAPDEDDESALTDPDADPDEWVFHDSLDDAPDTFEDAFETYAREELDAFGTKQPAPVRVFNETVVVLESVFVRVSDSKISCEFEASTSTDIESGNIQCQAKYDSETSRAAEAVHDREVIAREFQRCCDSLDHHIEWFNPLSPRDFIVEDAATDFLDE